MPHLIDEAPSAGPLRLVEVHCLELLNSPFSVSDPILSPDGQHLTRWHAGAPAPVEIASLESLEAVHVPNRVSFRNFGSLTGTAPDALAWVTDSRSVWAIRQETLNPSGFAISGLSPIMISLDGSTSALPELRHGSGPLDGLLWIGGDGLALAQFGMRGDYYRPEHEDSAPAFAMVDARRGRVLETLLFDQLPGASERINAGGGNIDAQDATARVLPDGRIRAVIQLSRWASRIGGEHVSHGGNWIVWTQGERPAEWTHPYPTDRTNPIALSPDGSKLLVVRPLEPGGWVISCRPGPCPESEPPIPVDGVAAELYDLETGTVLWTLSGRATERRGETARPAISDDGRYALVAMPPENARRLIALLSMADGHVLQTFSATSVHSYPQAFGFVSGSHDVWIASHNVVWRYEMTTD